MVTAQNGYKKLLLPSDLNDLTLLTMYSQPYSQYHEFGFCTILMDIALRSPDPYLYVAWVKEGTV